MRSRQSVFIHPRFGFSDFIRLRGRASRVLGVCHRKSLNTVNLPLFFFFFSFFIAGLIVFAGLYGSVFKKRYEYNTLESISPVTSCDSLFSLFCTRLLQFTHVFCFISFSLSAISFSLFCLVHFLCQRQLLMMVWGRVCRAPQVVWGLFVLVPLFQ